MSEANAMPEHATTAEDDARVAQAAADLGVEVPGGFFLTGMDDVDRHTAFTPGNASALRISAAILRRLDGHSVADSLAPPEEEPGPRPEWTPPEDPNDTEAWDAWMVERARHPEWPVVYNGPTDWLQLVATGTGLTALITCTASVLKQRDRINFAKWLVEKMEAQGLPVDAVAMVRAFEGGAAEPSRGTSAGPSGGKDLPAQPGEGEAPEV
jgi:hypothetical protein